MTWNAASPLPCFVRLLLVLLQVFPSSQEQHYCTAPDTSSPVRIYQAWYLARYSSYYQVQT